MLLNDLIDLHKSGGLREKLGDGWCYEPYDKASFEIHYRHRLGGIVVVIIPCRTGMVYDMIEVYRVINGKEERIYRDEYKMNNDVPLTELHFGVAEKLRTVYGY